MKIQDGGISPPADPQVAKAYCAGRAASVASALITANPHTTGTPEYLAWNRGWRLYAAAGTTTQPDNCANPAKFTVPTIAGTVTTGRTYNFVSTPALPGAYHYADGTPPEMAETGSTTHTFPAAGTYLVAFDILGKIAATTTKVVA